MDICSKLHANDITTTTTKKGKNGGGPMRGEIIGL